MEEERKLEKILEYRNFKELRNEFQMLEIDVGRKVRHEMEKRFNYWSSRETFIDYKNRFRKLLINITKRINYLMKYYGLWEEQSVEGQRINYRFRQNLIK
ncbi:MAG: hypothetical protein AABX28_01280 [Nanoarchaeota archaeon]